MWCTIYSILSEITFNMLFKNDQKAVAIYHQVLLYCNLSSKGAQQKAVNFLSTQSVPSNSCAQMSWIDTLCSERVADGDNCVTPYHILPRNNQYYEKISSVAANIDSP